MDFIEMSWIRLKDWYRSCRIWFKYNFTKPTFRTIGQVAKAYPFDYTYTYKVLKEQLKRQLYYFEHAEIKSNRDMPDIIRYIKLSINLIDIGFLNGGDVYPNGMFDIIKVDNGKMFLQPTIKVNLKNRKRFETENELLIYPDDLYSKKARCLFYEILRTKSESWWD